jgi:hypothetical protein
VRWLTSSTGREPKAGTNQAEFPRSLVAAWEAVANHRDQLPTPDDALLDEEEESDQGVEANARLTAMTAVALLILLAAEGFTILRVRALLTPHVVIGMLLVPPVLLKIGTTSWRFARYYLGSPQYRRKGPPPALLRLLGPFVVVLTLAVLGSGIALLLGPTSMRREMLLLHKATFILWFGAMALHVLGHFVDTMRLAPRDFYWRTRSQIQGAGPRRWALVGSLCLGLLLGVAVAPKVGPWLTERQVAQGTATGHETPVAPASEPLQPRGGGSVSGHL